MIRGLLYVGMARGRADERGLAAIRGLRAGVEDDKPQPTLAEFKALVREQYYMLLIDEEATLAAIPDLLPPDREVRRKALAALRRVLSAAGDMTGEAAQRLQRIAGLFGVESRPSAAGNATVEKLGLQRRPEAANRGAKTRGAAHDSCRQSQAARRQERSRSSASPMTSRSPGAAPRRFARLERSSPSTQPASTRHAQRSHSGSRLGAVVRTAP